MEKVYVIRFRLRNRPCDATSRAPSKAGKVKYKTDTKCIFSHNFFSSQHEHNTEQEIQNVPSLLSVILCKLRKISHSTDNHVNMSRRNILPPPILTGGFSQRIHFSFCEKSNFC